MEDDIPRRVARRPRTTAPFGGNRVVVAIVAAAVGLGVLLGVGAGLLGNGAASARPSARWDATTPPAPVIDAPSVVEEPTPPWSSVRPGRDGANDQSESGFNATGDPGGATDEYLPSEAPSSGEGTSAP